MAQVTVLGFWYPEGYPGRAFNLHEVVTIVYPTDATSKVRVRFRGSSVIPVEFDRAAFEAAYNAVYPV